MSEETAKVETPAVEKPKKPRAPRKPRQPKKAPEAPCPVQGAPRDAFNSRFTEAFGISNLFR